MSCAYEACGGGAIEKRAPNASFRGTVLVPGARPIQAPRRLHRLQHQLIQNSWKLGARWARPVGRALGAPSWARVGRAQLGARWARPVGRALGARWARRYRKARISHLRGAQRGPPPLVWCFCRQQLGNLGVEFFAGVGGASQSRAQRSQTIERMPQVWPWRSEPRRMKSELVWQIWTQSAIRRM
jgi:hypothetical protein